MERSHLGLQTARQASDHGPARAGGSKGKENGFAHRMCVKQDRRNEPLPVSAAEGSGEGWDGR